MPVPVDFFDSLFPGRPASSTGFATKLGPVAGVLKRSSMLATTCSWAVTDDLAVASASSSCCLAESSSSTLACNCSLEVLSCWTAASCSTRRRPNSSERLCANPSSSLSGRRLAPLPEPGADRPGRATNRPGGVRFPEGYGRLPAAWWPRSRSRCATRPAGTAPAVRACAGPGRAAPLWIPGNAPAPGARACAFLPGIGDGALRPRGAPAGRPPAGRAECFPGSCGSELRWFCRERFFRRPGPAGFAPAAGAWPAPRISGPRRLAAVGSAARRAWPARGDPLFRFFIDAGG